MEGMIYMFAQKYLVFVYHGKLGLDDLVQEGRLGVMKAHEKFDPSINPHFPTYAGYWIRAYIRNVCMAQGRTVRVPPKAQRDAHHSGKTMPLRNSNVDDLAPFLRAPEPEEDHRKLFRGVLDQAMRQLKPREKRALQMRFFEERTLEYIGDEFGVTRERARQICEKALDNISAHVPSHIKDYL